MATHPSVLVWRIPGMGEPGGLPSMGSHRVGHDWSDLAAAGGTVGKELACQCRRCKRHRFDPWVRKFTWSRKWQPISESLPGEFHGQRSLVGYKVVHDWAHTRTQYYLGQSKTDMHPILTLTIMNALWRASVWYVPWFLDRGQICVIVIIHILMANIFMWKITVLLISSETWDLADEYIKHTLKFKNLTQG